MSKMQAWSESLAVLVIDENRIRAAIIEAGSAGGRP